MDQELINTARELFKSRGISIPVISEYVGISRPTVTKYLRGEFKPGAYGWRQRDVFYLNKIISFLEKADESVKRTKGPRVKEYIADPIMLKVISNCDLPCTAPSLVERKSSDPVNIIAIAMFNLSKLENRFMSLMPRPAIVIATIDDKWREWPSGTFCVIKNGKRYVPGIAHIFMSDKFPKNNNPEAYGLQAVNIQSQFESLDDGTVTALGSVEVVGRVHRIEWNYV